MSRTVRRAAQIVDAIVEEPKSVLELAAAFGIHRSTMFRELQSLEDVGYVRRRRDGTYALGFHLVVLAQAALERLDLREIAYEHIRGLRSTIGDTIHLAALVDDAIVYVDKLEGPDRTRMYSRIGAAVHPQCSAVGKAILADLDADRRDAILAGVSWEAHTATTLTSRADLDRALDRAHVDGYATDDGEYEAFVNCVAVPIRTSAGTVGGLSVTALKMVKDLDALRTHLPLLREAARSIARASG